MAVIDQLLNSSLGPASPSPGTSDNLNDKLAIAQDTAPQAERNTALPGAKQMVIFLAVVFVMIYLCSAGERWVQGAKG